MSERLGALIQRHIDCVRGYLHAQIGKPASADLVSAPEIALDNLRAELDAVIADAERWRALMSSGRLHYMGSAGFDTTMKDPNGPRSTSNLVAKPRAGVPWHFGMEFWSHHPAAGDPRYPDDFERALMISYADAMRA